MARTALLIGAFSGILLAGGCDVDRELRMIGLIGDERPVEGPIGELPADPGPYPNLASVPSRPTEFTPVDVRVATMTELVQGREDAATRDRRLRGGDATVPTASEMEAGVLSVVPVPQDGDIGEIVERCTAARTCRVIGIAPVGAADAGVQRAAREAESLAARLREAGVPAGQLEVTSRIASGDTAGVEVIIEN